MAEAPDGRDLVVVEPLDPGKGALPGGRGQRQLFARNGLSLQHRVWLFLEEPSSSRAAHWYAFGFSLFILCSVVATIVQSLPALEDDPAWPVLEVVFNGTFTAEVLLRLAVCPNFARFFWNFYNVVDILAVMPFYVQLILTAYGGADGDVVYLFDLIQVVRPMLRLLKVTRNFAGFRLLVRSLKISATSLPVPLFFLVIMVLFASSLLYFFEREGEIRTMPIALWFSIVTISTVGYGGFVPGTVIGQLITICMAIFGVMYMAMPLSIIGLNFSLVWRDKDRHLLVDRTRQRLGDRGQGIDDVSAMFSKYDKSGDGGIDIFEFQEMLEEMQLGLQGERVVTLFRSLDLDESGLICRDEFLAAIFPSFQPQDEETTRDKLCQRATQCEQDLEDIVEKLDECSRLAKRVLASRGARPWSPAQQ